LELELAGEKILLSKYKCIVWSKSVFIADVHLGKTTHFRKSGIAIPNAIIRNDIDRIQKLILDFRPERVFFLGDLFHSAINHEWVIFNEFLVQHANIEFILIKGNHDILHEKVYQDSLLKIQEEPFAVKPFILSHHPLHFEEIGKNEINLCGHIHPGVSMKGKGKAYLTLACFYHEKNRIILPAFGKFTGLAKMKIKEGSSVFAVLNNSVNKVA
jgi:DNA ligase-associated metallophosphoesterase